MSNTPESENIKAEITRLEKREAELVAEEAATPTTRPHRRHLGKTRQELWRVREALKAARWSLPFALANEAEEARLRASCTPEEWAYIEEMTAKYEEYDKTVLEPERKARARREVEAERRREAFEVIEGGKSE